MEIEEYQKKRNETIKRLYKSRVKIWSIAERFAIDKNLVRDIVGLQKITEEKKKYVLRVGELR